MPPDIKQAEHKIIVVLPAYNAEKTLKKTCDDIPKDIVDDIILVDDSSQDKTVEIARQIGLKTIAHRHNKGYGATQKTCYTYALKAGADIIIMLHPDYQYDPKIIPELIKPIKEAEADLVLGSRISQGVITALKSGMPLYKLIGNRFLTMIENLIFGINLSEFHTGLRAYSRASLETIDFLKNSDGFTFDTEIIAQLLYQGFRICEVPVSARYDTDSSSINFVESVKYGTGTLCILVKYVSDKMGIKKYPLFRKKQGE